MQSHGLYVHGTPFHGPASRGHRHLRNAFRVAFLITALVIGLLTAPAATLAQGDLSGVEIETHLVAEGVWMLEGAGGNIGVTAGPDGVVLVDDQFAPLTDKILAAVKKISTQPLRFVVNTHWHFDHTGGNENMGEAGAVIVAHDNVRKRMETGQVIEALGREIPPAAEGALPVITFSRTVTFHLNGDTLVVQHLPPAHTDGDSVIYFQNANVVHMGDLLFNGTYPFVDLSSGGSVQGMLHAVEHVLDHTDEDTRFIPGHGPLAEREDVTGYRDMLEACLDAVGPLVEQGKSLEEVQEADPLAELNDTWGGGFINGEQFTAIVYQSLKEDPQGHQGDHQHHDHDQQREHENDEHREHEHGESHLG